MTGRIDRLKQAYRISIRWTAFPLHPETPEEGLSLQKLFAGRNLDVARVMADLKTTAAKLGLPFGQRTATYNSRRAQELGKWAEAENCGDTFHRLAFEAYFVKGYNIAEMEVLKDLAASAGLDPSKAEEILSERQYAPAVDADWRRSRTMGITAVPTFQMGAQRLVGAQRYAVLESMMQNGNVPPKPLP